MTRWSPGKNRGCLRGAASMRAASPTPASGGTASGNRESLIGRGSFVTLIVSSSVPALLAGTEILERPLDRDGFPPGPDVRAAAEALPDWRITRRPAWRFEEEHQPVAPEARHLDVGAVVRAVAGRHGMQEPRLLGARVEVLEHEADGESGDPFAVVESLLTARQRVDVRLEMDVGTVPRAIESPPAMRRRLHLERLKMDGGDFESRLRHALRVADGDLHRTGPGRGRQACHR